MNVPERDLSHSNDALTSSPEIRYNSTEAAAYASLATVETTYEIGYLFAAQLLGKLDDRSVLDFGAGAGRSSEFLHQLGADVVYAVDRSEAMVDEGRSKELPGVRYLLSARRDIPLATSMLDAAASFYVFIELTHRSQMDEACHEIHRVLKPGGKFVMVSTNPAAFGCSYKNFRYAKPQYRTSGERIKCWIHTNKGELELLDTYWTAQDYCRSLALAGFRIGSVCYPFGSKKAFPESDESLVPPAVVIEAIKESV